VRAQDRQRRDKYEQEADRVVDAVTEAVSESVPHIQQACPTCEEEELQRQPIE
jgi:hypothetical protein